MNGATPSGPRALVSMSANARTAACPRSGSREKRAIASCGTRRGTSCEPMPTRIASSTPAGHERRALTPSREEPAEHLPGGCERVRAEEDPREAHEVERDEARAPRMPGRGPRLHVAGSRASPAATDESQAVEPAPDDERPRRAVPEPAEQHRQHDVPIGEDRAPAVAAERDVDVVAKPPRERHVPPPPEVLDRGRRVRGVEVLREGEAEEQCDPDRNARVAGEVGVDLDGVRVDPDQELERRVLLGSAEDLVDDPVREGVRDHDLQEQPGGDEGERAAGVDRPWVAGRLELGDQLAGPDDRAGNEVGEEREIGRELRERGRLEVTAVGVDHVADRHEGVERDPDRKHDRAHLDRQVDPEVRREALGRVDEEAVVLEVREHAQVPGEGQRRAGPCAALGRRCARSGLRVPGSRACSRRAGR